MTYNRPKHYGFQNTNKNAQFRNRVGGYNSFSWFGKFATEKCNEVSSDYKKNDDTRQRQNVDALLLWSMRRICGSFLYRLWDRENLIFMQLHSMAPYVFGCLLKLHDEVWESGCNISVYHSQPVEMYMLRYIQPNMLLVGGCMVKYHIAIRGDLLLRTNSERFNESYTNT